MNWTKKWYKWLGCDNIDGSFAPKRLAAMIFLLGVSLAMMIMIFETVIHMALLKALDSL